MYVPDEGATARYRKDLMAMGFSASHAALLLVETVEEGRPVRREPPPKYRVTTGVDVMRRGQTVRRVLMLWYVFDDQEIAAETRDIDALATMLTESVSYLPVEQRAGYAPAPNLGKPTPLLEAATRKAA